MFSHVRIHSEEEIIKAGEMIYHSIKQFEEVQTLGSLRGASPEEIANVFAGLAHYKGFSISPELKYKLNQN